MLRHPLPRPRRAGARGRRPGLPPLSTDPSLASPRRTLSPATRRGLEVARAVSAVYVVFHHVVVTREHPPALLNLAASFGQEAVIVFFLVSGAVVHANEADRVRRPRGYYLRRLRRIYPPLVAAVLVSVLVWVLGLARPGVGATPTWGAAAGTLLGLADLSGTKPGVVTDPFMGNSPLWSLSYEVFFYLVYPLLALALRRYGVAARWGVGALGVVGYASYLAVPNHLSLVVAYLPVWWLGGALALTALRDGVPRLRTMVPELVGTTAVLATTAVGLLLHPWAGTTSFPFLTVRHVGVALALAAAVCAAPVRRAADTVTRRLGPAATVVAPVSYGLYVLHWPVLVTTVGQSPAWLALKAVPLVVLAVAVERWLPRLLPRAPRD